MSYFPSNLHDRDLYFPPNPHAWTPTPTPNTHHSILQSQGLRPEEVVVYGRRNLGLGVAPQLPYTPMDHAESYSDRRPIQFLPARWSGQGRECGGTGVFFPRPTNIKDTKTPVMIKKIEEQQKSSQQEQERVSALGRKALAVHLTPAEASLPEDWTYSYSP